MPFIFLEILMLCNAAERIIKAYTYIQFSREHSSVFYLRFSIFYSNQTDEIPNIYNYPMGMGATQTIILLAVNCNKNFTPLINTNALSWRLFFNNSILSIYFLRIILNTNLQPNFFSSLFSFFNT